MVLSGCNKETITFEQCVKMGGFIMESYPRQCSINNQNYVEIIVPGKSCVDKCGDDICQEEVCQGVDCDCTESAKICPMDCK